MCISFINEKKTHNRNKTPENTLKIIVQIPNKFH